MIRNLYPFDIIPLLFHKETALTNEAGSCIFWDAESATCCTYAPFLRQWLVPNERRFSWVYKDGNAIHGLISARERATPASWEIDYFYLPKTKNRDPQLLGDVSRELLEALTLHAGKRRVRKVFFRSYSSNPIFEIIRSSEFSIYLKEYLFHAESLKISPDKDETFSKLFSQAKAEGYIFRSRQSDDGNALYELIFKMQPAAVKNVESINLRDWQETREKGCLREKEIIFQKGNSIHGWLGIRKYVNWGHFRVMACASENDNLERIFLYVISLLRNKKNIYCTVRDYQDELKKMIEKKGFEKKEEFFLAFKEISITEKKHILVSQQA